ncbi:hypothetical protein PGC35_20065 [Psychrobacillus sp. PGGUH221]|uniref:hypothetical protein n=1 Tax=Psychrobacillus sp. PGGUH221 TaxID=3020058 RepID=UPI0035C77EAA
MKGNISLVGALGCMLLSGIWIHQHQESEVASAVKSEKEQLDNVLTMDILETCTS